VGVDITQAIGDMPAGLRWSILMVVIIGGFVISYAKIKSADNRARDAVLAAEIAAKRSEPTSNGFAARTANDLQYIVSSISTLRDDVKMYRESTDARLGRIEGTLLRTTERQQRRDENDG
jgi:hypothetical protein